jgi:Tfp pilus assembly protein PilF
MSLLMKALEKAAKDRGETTQPTPAAVPGAATPGNVIPGTAPIPRTATAPAMELALEPLAADTPEPERKPAPATAARAEPRSKSTDQARAATVLQASVTAAPLATGGGSRRLKLAVILAILAGVAVIGFAIYVYLQITNPGLFIRQAPPAARPPLAQTPAPVPVAPAPITTDKLVAAGSGNAEPAAPATPAVEAAPVQRPAPPASPARAEAPRDSIKVSTTNAEPQLDPRLGEAYAALQSGKLGAARQLYADAARSDSRNVQALLGVAAVAMQEDNTDEASRTYFRVLDLEPRNTYAQAGLVALMGRADPVAAEAKLKQLIGREPLASLHFTLGNLYGDQSRWAEAQQSYFQAHHLEPGNPDYAYNLAVGLEHVGQTRLAADYYRRALELAQSRGRAGFNLNQAQDRIRQLAAQPE